MGAGTLRMVNNLDLFLLFQLQLKNCNNDTNVKLSGFVFAFHLAPPGFESQQSILLSFILQSNLCCIRLCIVKRTKMKKREAEFGLFYASMCHGFLYQI